MRRGGFDNKNADTFGRELVLRKSVMPLGNLRARPALPKGCAPCAALHRTGPSATNDTHLGPRRPFVLMVRLDESTSIWNDQRSLPTASLSLVEASGG